jgi:putative transposase
LPPLLHWNHSPMARKWSNVNLPGALHFVTGNFLNRIPLFSDSACCGAFLETLSDLNQRWPSKLIAFVLMPDHFHLISNPRDGHIKEFIGTLKSLTAKRILTQRKSGRVRISGQVWQESFKAMPLWSGWMIWQKINYIHANPVKAGVVKATKDYRWSSFHSYYSSGEELITIDRDWAWAEDAEKLSSAVRALGKSGGKPPFLT